MFRRLRKLIGNDRGNVAVMVALSLMPLSVAALGALDIARAMAAKLVLQDSLDAAALAATKSTVSDPTILQSSGDRIFHQNLVLDSDVTLSSDTFAFGTGGIVVADASAAVRPLIIGFIIGGPIKVGAHTEVKRAANALEVALVLDNTGSMADPLGSGSTSKIDALKTAASSMIDTLAAAAQRSGPNSVKVSLVPYTMTVNVGSQYSGAAWLSPGLPGVYGPDIFSTPGTNRLTLFQQLGTSWAGCVESRPAPYDVTEAPPTPGTPGTLYVPYFAPDEPGSSSSSYWGGQTWYNNYLNDSTSSTSWSVRQGSVAKYKASNIVNSGGNPSTGYQYGPNAGCDIQPLHRLSNDFASVKTAINAMTVGGDTDIKAGVMWGWHTLSPNAPFADGVAYNTQGATKAMVLMTDGQNHNVPVGNNNSSLYSGIGYIWQNRIGITSGSLNQRIAILDQKLGQACANARAAGIIMYVVVLVDPTVDQSTVEACASSSDKLYLVTDTSQLTGVFSTIADQLAKLHLSK